MIFDDDEIKAAANRLRQQGWDRPSDEQTKEQRDRKALRKVHRPKADKGFGEMSGDVKSAGLWLAANLDRVPRPLRLTISTKFGLSYDDAGRAVGEAGRLLGREL